MGSRGRGGGGGFLGIFLGLGNRAIHHFVHSWPVSSPFSYVQTCLACNNLPTTNVASRGKERWQLGALAQPSGLLYEEIWRSHISCQFGGSAGKLYLSGAKKEGTLGVPYVEKHPSEIIIGRMIFIGWRYRTACGLSFRFAFKTTFFPPDGLVNGRNVLLAGVIFASKPKKSE